MTGRARIILGVASAGVTALFLLSALWTVRYSWQAGEDERTLGISGGCLFNDVWRGWKADGWTVKPLSSGLRGEYFWTSFNMSHAGYDIQRIPLWPVPSLLALGALGSWVPVLARRLRSARGRCGSCGYDRVGLAVSSRCPECGESAL